MVLNEKSKPFLVLILRFLTKKRLWFLNCAGSYKKWVYLILVFMNGIPLNYYGSILEWNFWT